MKTKAIIFTVNFLFIVALVSVNTFAETRTSTSGNYIIDDDVTSSGGGYTTSTNYSAESTVGEFGADTEAQSANFYERSGFQNLERSPYFGFSVNENIVNLGDLSESTVKTGSITFQVMTSSRFGYSVQYTGSTLTNQTTSATVDAIGATAETSSTGTEQFGINLVANTSPSVGANPSGGVGVASGQYATANNFAFNSGDQVAAASTYSNYTVYTTSFMCNVAPLMDPGVYSTDVTFIATGNF